MMGAKTLAALIVEGAAIRENSWLEYDRRYDLNITQAVQKAAIERITGSDAERMVLPASLLLRKCWQDAIEWATATKNEES